MSPARESEWIAFGSMQRAHGVHGEVRLRNYDPTTEWPRGAHDVQLAFGAGEVREYRVESVRGRSSALIIKLQDIDSREDAQALTGAELSIPRGALPPLAPGEFYLFELQGMQAEDMTGTDLGVVVSVRQLGDQTLAEIEGPLGRCLLPLVNDNVARVDRSRAVVVVRGTDGLWGVE
ncbi:MAG: ribosome maturation factor RimM [Myxococcota bacterium]